MPNGRRSRPATGSFRIRASPYHFLSSRGTSSAGLDVETVIQSLRCEGYIRGIVRRDVFAQFPRAGQNIEAGMTMELEVTSTSASWGEWNSSSSRKSRASTRVPSGVCSRKRVRHILDLDHLRHVISMSACSPHVKVPAAHRTSRRTIDAETQNSQNSDLQIPASAHSAHSALPY